MMRFLIKLIVLLLIIWVTGFVWFLRDIPTQLKDATTRTDAVVVLTGDRGRIEEGVRLLSLGQAEALFISGVGKGAQMKELFSQNAYGNLIPHITLGREARSTRGNALETSEWMEKQNYQSMRLVTSYYHIPRSLAVFRRAMPEMEIIPHPVFPDSFQPAGWWQTPGKLRLAALEYNKHLVLMVQSWLA